MWSCNPYAGGLVFITSRSLQLCAQTVLFSHLPIFFPFTHSHYPKSHWTIYRLKNCGWTPRSGGFANTGGLVHICMQIPELHRQTLQDPSACSGDLVGTEGEGGHHASCIWDVCLLEIVGSCKQPSCRPPVRCESSSGDSANLTATCLKHRSTERETLKVEPL